MRPTILAISIALLLTACAAPPPIKPRSDVASVAVERDDFKKITRYNGSDLATDRRDTLILRAWRHDGGELKYQIYLSDYYAGEWRFYTEAYDRSGVRMNVSLIGRRVGSCSRYGGCSHFETVALNVDRPYLESAQKEGVSFQVSGRAGKESFYIPPVYISSFLDQVR